MPAVLMLWAAAMCVGVIGDAGDPGDAEARRPEVGEIRTDALTRYYACLTEQVSIRPRGDPALPDAIMTLFEVERELAKRRRERAAREL